MKKIEKWRKFKLKGDYILNTNIGLVFKRMRGVNQRWSAHRNKNIITTFFAHYDIINQNFIDKTYNLTEKQLKKIFSNPHHKFFNKYKLFDNFDMVQLHASRIIVAIEPHNIKLKPYNTIINDMFEKYKNTKPELLI